MRKSKIFILVSLCLIIALFVSFYGIYNRIFPKAPPIEPPHPDTILSVTVKNHNEEKMNLDDIYAFYDLILNSEPTRIMSTNDYPDTRPYYEVSISTENSYYRYFLYSSGGRDYIEIPYIGVYEIQNFKIDNLF